jgi:predicted small lipoprotein YifL
MKLNKILNYSLAAVMLFLLSACGGLKFNMYTPQDDAVLGQLLDVEIRNNPVEYPIYNQQRSKKLLTAHGG